MTPISIFCYSPSNTDVCAFLRNVGPHTLMDKYYPGQYHFTFAEGANSKVRGNIHWNYLIGNDIIFVQRPYTEDDLRVCQMAKDLGKVLIIEFDDLLTQVHPSYQYYNEYYGCDKYITPMLALSDAVVVSTRQLGREMKKLYEHANIKVIPNGLQDYMKLPEKRSDGLGILWRGGGTHHVPDIQPSAGSFIACKDIHQTFIGLNPWFITDNHKNWSVLQINDHTTYRNALADRLWSVCPVPLADIPFNHCKSRLGWIEGIYAGCVVLANEMFEDFQNLGGCRLYRNEQQLTDLMRMYGTDKTLADKEWQKGRDQIEESGRVSIINKKRHELYVSLV